MEASLYGLSLNFTKTEHLEHRQTPATPWEKTTLTAFQHRINLAHVAFAKLAPSWRSRVPDAVKVRIFQSNVVPVLRYGLSSLTMEDKHFAKVDSWYYRSRRRAINMKASYYSRISNKSVWIRAVLPSQTILPAQIKQLTECLATPQDDPLFHVIFCPGYEDRVGIQKNSKRGPPPPHWLGLVTAKAMEVFHQQVTQDPEYPRASSISFRLP